MVKQPPSQTKEPVSQGSAEESQPSDKEQTSKSIESEQAALLETLKRVQAEFINYKNRTDRDRDQHIKRATKDLIADILPVLDVFELALKHVKEHNDTTKGFEMVYHQLLDVLKKNGVEVIDQTGVPEDHKIHQVIDINAEAGKTNTVIEIVQKGYKLHDYVLRAAKVRVQSSTSSKTHHPAKDVQRNTSEEGQ